MTKTNPTHRSDPAPADIEAVGEAKHDASDKRCAEVNGIEGPLCLVERIIQAGDHQVLVLGTSGNTKSK